MNIFVLAGSLVAMVAFLPLTISVWKKDVTQSLATFVLWGLLDVIAAGSIMAKGGNFLLPAMYAALSFSVVIAVLRTKTATWGWLESVTAVLVLASIVVWALVGDREATIVSSLGVAIASAPQLVDFWKAPRKSPLGTYVGFTVANGLSLIGGNAWTVEERFYPAVCTVMTATFVLVAARRWLPNYRLASTK